ncbi:hypothetical protein NADFUDRAFT_81872 [Nadsonia fulvescens var. elongata DSM 6958]|uniref:MARVEL domain-containing protein n=1 Tax=Nadsonia fulvescens var. elongata DSM 6958 TaxID=857566 RepID=A0A1E3PPL5_9ASCO|nr:hypothetical protein NADFUDRAFT_81872 [Nadsonia fulvescens var. elongata DSM 6958]
MIKIITFFRIIQFILAVIVLALSAATINNTLNGYEGVDAFSIFCAILTGITVVYFIARDEYRKYKKTTLVVTGLELINNVFWFANFIALAAKRGPGTCTDLRFFDNNNNSVVLESDNGCRTGKASIAFAAFTWATFIITSWLIIRARLSTMLDHDAPTENENPTTLPSVILTPATADLEAGRNDPVRPDTNRMVDLERDSQIVEPEKVYSPNNL